MFNTANINFGWQDIKSIVIYQKMKERIEVIIYSVYRTERSDICTVLLSHNYGKL